MLTINEHILVLLTFPNIPRKCCVCIFEKQFSVHIYIDTGCALSLAPRMFYDDHLQQLHLRPTKVILSTYTHENVLPECEVAIKMKYKNITRNIPLLITPTGSTPLFGRNWLHKSNLDWPNLP